MGLISLSYGFCKTIHKILVIILNIPFGFINRFNYLETITIEKCPVPAIYTHTHSFLFPASTMVILPPDSPFASHSLNSPHIPPEGHQLHLYVWLSPITEGVHSAYRFGYPCHRIRTLQKPLSTNSS